MNSLKAQSLKPLYPLLFAGSRCRPNSHPVCETSDVEDLGLVCGLVGVKHEPALNRAGPLNDNDNCTGSIFCKCDPGYLRENDNRNAK
jgi:hypothetical protein